MREKIDYASILDEKLVGDVLKYNWEALRELFRRYQRPFFNLAFRFTGDRYAAEDLTSEILWRIYGYLKTFDQSKKFKPWAYKVATNTCLTYVSKELSIKKQVLRIEEESEDGKKLEDDLEDKKANLIEETQKNEISERVQKALMKLPKKYRLALYLFYFEELKYEEIANTLDLPVNTVRTHLKRGKEKMKMELTDLC